MDIIFLALAWTFVIGFIDLIRVYN